MLKLSLILKNDIWLELGSAASDLNITMTETRQDDIFLSIKVILEVSDPGLVYILHYKFLVILALPNEHFDV